MKTKTDLGLKKIWDARKHISEKCSYDPEKLIKYYQDKQKLHKNRLVTSILQTSSIVSEKDAEYNSEKTK